ncbi:hypothetical protein EOB59_05500 [Mesorhizobium sp. M7A.F.Ca.MR.176.00.0.0]|uniref:putative Ig domain-containing protein n=1 Tax=Mesorhizobium sp. M7A.F.Ca.MR.176.00.0.0 TaxID=2496776 RepID=UPI000FD5FB11|nr:putative Ig domain-containing protein [Mesorhizobium sp. M7A.F.Ca.MR.176.00.0.0]RUU92814.1 hypothetical protein EOB59_05500 [Mesorhizobium sp. M7A.F.Ca.MR.176.00.0.0]
MLMLTQLFGFGDGQQSAGGGSPLGISGIPVLTTIEDVAYAGFTVSATGGTAPYTFSVHAGTLPTGITLNSSTGVVSGTPTTPGTSTGIVIRVTDNVSATADLASFDLEVQAAGPVTYQGTNSFGGTHTGNTYTNAPIGPASATRLVVAVVQCRRAANSARTITGVTIGGNSAPILVQTNVVDGVSSGITVGIAALVVPSGTTATVVATFSGAGSQSAVSVYTIDGLASTTATDTASATGNNASSSTLDVNANGVVIAGFAGAGGTLGDMTLVGVTENDDRDVFDAAGTLTHARFAAGSIANLASETNRTISVSSSANIEALAVASWA